MPTYTFRCDGCGEELARLMSFEERGEHELEHHDVVCGGVFRQVIGSAYFRRSIGQHFNHSVGTVVRGESDILSHLHRQSDEASARIGIPHNFELVDPRDAAASGVTEQGIAETEKRAVDSGAQSAKLYL